MAGVGKNYYFIHRALKTLLGQDLALDLDDVADFCGLRRGRRDLLH